MVGTKLNGTDDGAVPVVGPIVDKSGAKVVLLGLGVVVGKIVG